MVEGAFVYPLLQSKKTYDTCMVKTDANNSKCDAIFYTTAENVRKGMLQSFNKENVVTGELFNKMNNLKTVVNNNTAEIRNATDATTFAKAVKGAFDADKSSVMPTQSSATPTNTSATSATSVTSATPSSETSATPSNTTSVTSATPSNASSATSVTSASSETSAKNANPTSMPVMQQPPEAVAPPPEVAAASAGGG
jgi:hypothetical protein